MKLSQLDRCASFALLGPGFADGWRLIAPLRSAPEGPVVFLPYEAEPAAARRFEGEAQKFAALDFDVLPAALAPQLDRHSHREGVEAIRAAIAAGEVYQVNLTLRARLAPVGGASLFAALCRAGIPRFAAWVRLPDGTELVSASPELFFQLAGRRIRCEPMKGTAPLDDGEAFDRSVKDRAELAMITDLVRNDLTPICEPRSVQVVNERRRVPLAYALQAVSDVEGQLLEGAGVAAALAALHPGGSITGAPKPIARKMIAQLESSPRGAYCGTLGYCEGERATFSLLIRTAERTPQGWVYSVGGGIVWQSDAAAELAEAQLKLGALR
ncbi:MAG: para-aminobenzoate synthase, subunit [Myxococcaceae bacterium]|nr:para-aminobenzoate synthase, subunit [Myxococcaceae bacterium]